MKHLRPSLRGTLKPRMRSKVNIWLRQRLTVARTVAWAGEVSAGQEGVSTPQFQETRRFPSALDP